jgi:hypothetical protein
VPHAAPTPARQAASRANGARSRGPATAAGKTRAARNGTRHGLRGGPFALLPGEDADELARLHAAVTADWAPRDACERHWVRELVAALWRQARLRGLELAALDAAAGERPPSEASLKRLLTFARYGARVDKDLATALRALRALRDRRPDAHVTEPPERTSEHDAPATQAQIRTNDVLSPTAEPPRTSEPEPTPTLPAPAAPAMPPLNRNQRRRLEALERAARRWAA